MSIIGWNQLNFGPYSDLCCYVSIAVVSLVRL